jgi:perosamine synthetase
MAKKIFDHSDVTAVERVLTSGNLSWTSGLASKEFETMVAARLGVKHVIALHSAMAGLQYALMAGGIGEGDEVICDPIVPFGAYAALYVHARPVFADVDPRTFNVAPASIRERLTLRTKAIIVTHLFGLPARMDDIMAIAAEHKPVVVEDCAHALFAERSGQPVGTFGSAGVFSFQQSKHMTTGDGGMLLTNDSYVDQQIRRMLSFGALAPRLSWNFRMNELTAAVAMVQFGRAEGYVAEDRRSADLYNQVAAGSDILVPQARDAESAHSYHIWGAVYVGDSDGGTDQETFERICREEQVAASFGYLTVPVYLHPEFSLGSPFGFSVWRDAGYVPYRRGYCPVAERLMPRFVLVTISTGSYDDHQRNAAALDRALRRLERGA